MKSLISFLNKGRVVTKLTIVTIVMATLSGILMITINTKLVANRLILNKTELLQRILEEQTRGTATLLNEASRSADVLSVSPELRKYLGKKTVLRQDEETLMVLNHFSLGRNYSEVYILDQKGKVLLSTDPLLLDNMFDYRKYFTEARQGKPYTEIVWGKVTDKLGFYFSRPIRGDDGQVLGVLVIKHDVDDIFRGLETSKVREMANILLVNNDGVVIYSNRQDYVLKSLAKLDSVALAELETSKKYMGREIGSLWFSEALTAIRSGAGTLEPIKIYNFDDKMTEWVSVVKVRPYPFFLMAEMDQKDVMLTVASITARFYWLFGILATMVLLVQIGMIRWMLLPLRKIRDYARSVAGGNLEVRPPDDVQGELRELVNDIRDMMKGIKNYNQNLEIRVKQRTRELASALFEIKKRSIDQKRTRIAMGNVMEDIAKERARAENLVQELEKFKLATDNSSEHIVITDADGKILYANKAAERNTGYSQKEIINNRPSLWGKQMTKDFYQKMWDVIKTRREAYTGELTNRRKSGELYEVKISIDPILDRTGKVIFFVGIERDISEEKELERMKTEFLSVASHQLRTPLGGMRWSLEMLLGGDYGKLTDKVSAVTKDLYVNNMRMIDLVNDLLDVSRIDQGEDFDNPEAVDINEELQSIEKEFASLIDSKKLKLINKLDKKVGAIRADKQKIREIFDNIISNSVKYNKWNGKIWLTTSKVSDGVRVVVRDNGIGVSRKDMGRLKTRFFRAENAIKSEVEGSGLGLYVANKYVDEWGGTLHISSEPDKGMTVEIFLPHKLKLKNREIKNGETTK